MRPADRQPDLSHGRVWEAREVEPARSRALRGMGWRTRIAIVVVAVFLAGGVLALWEIAS